VSGTQGASAARTPETTVPAQVLGRAPGGDMLLRVGDAVLRVPTDSPLPPGTDLQVTLAPVIPAAAPVGPDAATEAAPQPETAAAPRSLGEILGHLAVIDGGAQAGGLVARLPGAGSNAIAGLIAFVLGLRGGDARQWLGDRAAQALERAGHGGLLERLGDEFRALSRGPGDTAAPPDWRQVALPWHDGERLSMATLWLHREAPDDDGGETGGPGTRLIVDVELSRLGPMRIDGLYRPGRFDVILRGASGLDETMRGNMRTLFDGIVTASGLSGSLSFQNSAPTRPKDDAP